MKTAAGLALAALLTSSAFAQRLGYGNAGFGNVAFPGGGHPPFVFNQPGFANEGFGNVVFPGTGHPPITNPFSITRPGFASRLGNTVAGRPPGGGFDHRGRNNFVYVPFAYPVYTGGYYPPYPAPDGGQAGGNVTVVYPPQAAPVTIINQIPPAAAPAQPAAPQEGFQTYQAPAENTASAPAAENAQGNDEYYLIAFKDHSIYPALAYWVEGDTLHYFTKGNVHNQVSLLLVDKPLTERLNSERNISMHLP